jgi:hypothetical protein
MQANMIVEVRLMTRNGRHTHAVTSTQRIAERDGTCIDRCIRMADVPRRRSDHLKKKKFRDSYVGIPPGNLFCTTATVPAHC